MPEESRRRRSQPVHASRAGRSKRHMTLAAEQRPPRRTGRLEKPTPPASPAESADITALRAECATLKAQVQALEARQTEIANRLAWALDALDGIIGNGGK